MLLTMQEAAAKAEELGHHYSAGTLKNAAAAWQKGEPGLKAEKKGKTYLTTLDDLNAWLADAQRGRVGRPAESNPDPHPKRPRGRPRKDAAP